MCERRMARLLIRAFSQIKKTMANRSSIPERWECYRPLGKIIPGTRFIPFKVPLKENYFKKVEEKDWFSPMILIQMLGDQGQQLGVVIDLTFTHKYYNKEEFTSKSIGHKKILTRGHEVPSQDVYDDFAETVKKYDDNGHLIGVHCTHGVNRTGYLVCRYMIEELDMEPETAISLFNEARGHELERPNYLHDLKRRERGQSSYNSQHKGQVNAEDGAENSARPPMKASWRQHKEDHPGWQQKNGRRRRHDDASRYTTGHDRSAADWRHGNGSGEQWNSYSSVSWRNRSDTRFAQNDQSCSGTSWRDRSHGSRHHNKRQRSGHNDFHSDEGHAYDYYDYSRTHDSGLPNRRWHDSHYDDVSSHNRISHRWQNSDVRSRQHWDGKDRNLEIASDGRRGRGGGGRPARGRSRYV